MPHFKPQYNTSSAMEGEIEETDLTFLNVCFNIQMCRGLVTPHNMKSTSNAQFSKYKLD